MSLPRLLATLLYAAAICLPLAARAIIAGQLPPIHAAVARGDAAFVGQWIRDGRSVDEEYDNTASCIHGCFSNVRRVTPLMVAADHGDLAMVKMLVEAGADVNRESGFPTAPDPMYQLPPVAVFDYAVGSGNVQVVEYLASRPQFNHPPPHLPKNFQEAFWGACGELRYSDRRLKVAEFLLATYGPQQATNALVRISDSGRCPSLVHLLLDAGVKPDAAAMSMAAHAGLTDLVRLYIAKGAPLNEEVTGQWTAAALLLPLSEAARAARVELVEVLLEAGADPNRRGRLDLFPIEYAIEGGSNNCPASLATVKLLLDHGARAGVDRAIDLIDHMAKTECMAAKRALLSGVPR